MRTVLDYYRIFVGWPANAGSLQAALTDFKSLPVDEQMRFRSIVTSAVVRKSIEGSQEANDALKFF